MSSVTFSTSVGGDNSTVTDDASASTGLANGGHRTRFVPTLAQVVAVAGHVVTKAGEADASALAAASSASTAASAIVSAAATAANDAAAAATAAAGASASAASGSASAASGSASAASGSASAASASAASAANLAAGITATSTTSLTISIASKSLTVQTGKQFTAGQFVLIANTADPAKYMFGQVTSYNSGTGALVVDSSVIAGSGTLTAWVVSLSGIRGVIGVGLTAQTVGFTAAAGTTVKTLTVDEDVTISAIKAGAYPGKVARSDRTSNTILGVADNGTLIDVTSGSFTQTFTAAATLGNGWWCMYRNIGTGGITLDPNASETIDGVTSGLIVPGDMYTIFCDGSGFVTERRCAGPMLTLLKTSSGSWTVPLGVRKVKATVVGGGGGCKSTSSAGHAGGGGGTAIKTYAVAPGATCTYTVGAAGSIGTYGTAGGNSTFTYSSTTITGSGGTIDNATGGNLSAGGGASGGDVNLPGRAGLPITGTTSSNANIAGCSAFGFGGISRNDSNTNYGVATGYGGGSPGSGNGYDINATAGCVIIEY